MRCARQFVFVRAFSKEYTVQQTAQAGDTAIRLIGKVGITNSLYYTWLVQEGGGSKGKVTTMFILEYISSVTSCRSEYKGIFRYIAHMDHINIMTSKEAEH